MYKIGAVTIGQSPRSDVIADIRPILGSEVDVVEAGALDGLTKEEIAKLVPKEGDYVLVTRLRDGTSVKVAERYITPLLQDKISNLFESGIPVVLLLCTGEFPEFPAKGLLIRPQRILFEVTKAIGAGLKLGVFTPSDDQIEQSRKRWSTITKELQVVAASPYINSDSSVSNGAEQLSKWGAQIIVMDCIGYTYQMKRRVKEITSCSVILARTVASRIAKELLE
ncbi:AroM family protein [Acetomicrobium mobile]|jgi:protein AroM|uniref:AroM family protein n=1 Tax=Acetomicrobium mobile TaxID=97477 RepID=UPI0026ECDB39|nr:AroM family protein [Acetomicrobium mobile]